MTMTGDEAVRTGLASQLVPLWRYGLVLSASRQAAEDLVQATCLRALERSHQFMPGTRLDHWLFAILRSIWLNELRARRMREGTGVEDAETVLSFDGAGAMETNILAAQVLREVWGLPEAQRETVYLVYVEGLSYAEAAQALGIPAGTVMSRLAAARARLAALRDEVKPTRGENHGAG